MLEPFQLPFVQRGMLEIAVLSVGAGLLGTWIVLRGLAFFSHAVGAAAFPGLVLADGLGFAAPLGALGAALLFAAGVGALSRVRRTGYDNLTALALTGALALGVLLASDVFHSGTNIETLLFGSLFLVEPRDIALAAAAKLSSPAAQATRCAPRSRPASRNESSAAAKESSTSTGTVCSVRVQHARPRRSSVA